MQSDFISIDYLAPALGCLGGFVAGLTTRTAFEKASPGIGATAQLMQVLVFSAGGAAFGSVVNLVADRLLAHSALDSILSVGKLGITGSLAFFISEHLLAKMCRSDQLITAGAALTSAACCYYVL